MRELAYVNGVYCPVTEARVSIEDRGFQFGDSVYEVISAYDGKLFLAEEHLRRLDESLAGIGLEFATDSLMPVILEGLAQSEIRDAMIYIQITRGVSPRSHELRPGVSPTVVMTFKPLPPIPKRQREEGVKLMTVRDNRWADCHIKATTLLPNVLARNQALRAGFDDALFVTADGEARECTSANLFVIDGSEIVIPPRNEAILHGVTQGFLLGCAAEMGLSVTEHPVRLETLFDAGEVFITSTIIEVLGVSSLDGKTIGDGSVGPTTKRFYDEYQAHCRTGVRAGL